MNNRLKWLFGTGAGAAAMYFFDPARGRYRRALVRDQVLHAGRKAKRGAGAVGRDVRNRAVGTTAHMRSALDARQPPDDVLVGRIRACLGRVVTHPSSIEVEARDGVVTLWGPILEKEVKPLIAYVRDVRGVKDVQNRLEVHPEPDRIPGLQGSPRPRSGRRSAFMQDKWSPAARAAGGFAGATAAAYGFSRNDPYGNAVGLAGLLLLGRAVTNLELRELLGIGATEGVVRVQKSIRIDAPVEKVFSIWNDFESYPSFMTHVRRVRRIDDRRGEQERWRWTVRGPTGKNVEFDAIVTAREGNRMLGWRTDRGTLVRHAGHVHFKRNPDGSTTVDVQMVYSPVAGAIGHTVAWLLGADPKHRMDDDLLRMKTFIETGIRPHDAAQPREDEAAHATP